MRFQKLTDEEEHLGAAIVHGAYTIHVTLGPGCWKKHTKLVCVTSFENSD